MNEKRGEPVGEGEGNPPFSENLAALDLENPDIPPEGECWCEIDPAIGCPLLGRWEIRALYERRLPMSGEPQDRNWFLYWECATQAEQWEFSDDQVVVMFRPDADAPSGIKTEDYWFSYVPESKRLYIEIPSYLTDGGLDFIWTERYLVRMLSPDRAVLYDFDGESEFGHCHLAFLLERIVVPAATRNKQ